MDPDRPGANTVFLQVRRLTATAPQVTRAQVTVRQPGQPGQTLTGTPVGAGHYRFPKARLDGQGRLTVTVALDRSAGPPARASFAWPVRPPLPGQGGTGLLAVPWAPALNAAAALLAVGLAAAVAVWLARVRARRRAAYETTVSAQR